MRQILGTAVIAAVVGMSMPALAEGGDVKKGAKVYKRCAACHNVNKEKNKVGPHLVGIIDRKAGTVEKFKYSKALLKMAEGDSGLVWTKENLDKYLTKPKAFIKRGKMAFAGLKKESDRANVIAYLEEASKK